MKDKLIFKDGTEIELESGASLVGISLLFPSIQDMADAWSEMTAENLSEVSIQNGDGVTVGRYENLVLESGTLYPRKDGILVSFRLREKTEMEMRMDAIESEQEMQNGAIDDLGAITSALAEAQEGGLS